MTSSVWNAGNGSRAGSQWRPVQPPEKGLWGWEGGAQAACSAPHSPSGKGIAGRSAGRGSREPRGAEEVGGEGGLWILYRKLHCSRPALPPSTNPWFWRTRAVWPPDSCGNAAWGLRRPCRAQHSPGRCWEAASRWWRPLTSSLWVLPKSVSIWAKHKFNGLQSLSDLNVICKPHKSSKQCWHYRNKYAWWSGALQVSSNFLTVDSLQFFQFVPTVYGHSRCTQYYAHYETDTMQSVKSLGGSIKTNSSLTTCMLTV